MNHKEKWDKLLSENGYQEKYIFSDSKEGRIEPISYDESGYRDYETLVYKDKILKECLGDFSDKVVMEIGCGDGRMTKFFAKDFNYVYAVDISRKVIEKGKERLRNYKNIGWFETDGRELPICQVDFIFSYATFQHCRIDMIRDNFKSMHKILLRTGIAKIQVRGKEISQDKWYSGDWFTPEELKELVKECGFESHSIWHDPNERRYLWIWLI